MLVRSFQVEVGRIGELTGVGNVAAICTQDAPVGGAGIEPDVERIAHFLVQLRLVAQQLGRIEPEPGFDAILLHPLRHFLQQLEGTRM